MAAGEDRMDLKEQVSRLKEELATQQELVEILKTDHATALATLKQKYESEKAIVTETMYELCSELKQLREDSDNVLLVRDKCDVYITRLEEQGVQLVDSEEETELKSTSFATLMQKCKSKEGMIMEGMKTMEARISELDQGSLYYNTFLEILLTAAMEEKKTLNELLKQAIEQKLALTQKLEDLEFDCRKKSKPFMIGILLIVIYFIYNYYV